MQVITRSTYRALLKQANIVDKSVSIRAMLCASPIHVYDRKRGEWTAFEGAKDWHDSRKAVDNLIRRLNDGKEWYHPSLDTTKTHSGFLKGELCDFVRRMYRTSPFSTQNLNFAFSAVKSLNHTLSASTILTPLAEEAQEGFTARKEEFRLLTSVPHNPAPSTSPGYSVAGLAATPNEGIRLLVAHPLLPGFFRHNIILVVRSDPEGAFGIIINRPLTNGDGVVIPVWSAVPDPHPLLAKHLAQNPIMIGGPVATANSVEQSMVIIHQFPEVKDSVRISSDAGCSLCIGGDMDEMAKLLDEGKASPRDFLCVLGYSGWGHDQLEGEVERGSWFCLRHQCTDTDADKNTSTELVLQSSRSYFNAGVDKAEDPTSSWCELLRCLGGDYAELTRLQTLSKFQFDEEDDES